ncbi:phage protein NinX family protein [Morganella morganii]|uniref:Recombinase n=1 Tax=Morganella morganii TaxID=582 RepID=A0AAU8ZNK0_MORMO|nr:phage protein NinX family protein [Morganella morganii]AWC94417.1 recombinase [Morganella morganii]EKW8485660.1 DUF2591 family protein [Morganella morganii]
MNKYRDKSDFDINKAVAEELIQSGFIIGVEYHDKHILVRDKYANNYPFAPCNNPAVAMPIVIENKIAIAFSSNTGKWCAYAGYMMGDRGWDIYERPTISAFSDSYYRAAMELFLIMKDVENE